MGYTPYLNENKNSKGGDIIITMKEYHKTNWEDIYKIKISDPDDSMQHHEVIKTLLVMKLLKAHQKDRKHIRIYTEFPAVNGKIADVYYENLRTREAYAFEIQKKVTKKWLKETNKIYGEWASIIFKYTNWYLIDLNLMSKNIEELNKELDEFVV